MFRFQLNYFLLTVLLFLIELLIALFVYDNFVRPFIGDVLVVILLYCFLRAFFNVPVMVAAVVVLLFSFTIEILQSVNIVKILGIQDSKIARTVVGTSFDWMDILAYTIGVLLVLLLEYKKQIRGFSN